jgi:hypothetical protein
MVTFGLDIYVFCTAMHTYHYKHYRWKLGQFLKYFVLFGYYTMSKVQKLSFQFLSKAF